MMGDAGGLEWQIWLKKKMQFSKKVLAEGRGWEGGQAWGQSGTAPLF